MRVRRQLLTIAIFKYDSLYFDIIHKYKTQHGSDCLRIVSKEQDPQGYPQFHALCQQEGHLSHFFKLRSVPAHSR